jgi:hypothetical protein
MPATQIKKRITTEAPRHGGKTRGRFVKFEISVPLLPNLTNSVVFWRKTGDLINSIISSSFSNDKSLLEIVPRRFCAWGDFKQPLLLRASSYLRGESFPI